MSLSVESNGKEGGVVAKHQSVGGQQVVTTLGAAGECQISANMVDQDGRRGHQGGRSIVALATEGLAAQIASRGLEVAGGETGDSGEVVVAELLAPVGLEGDFGP